MLKSLNENIITKIIKTLKLMDKETRLEIRQKNNMKKTGN